MGLSREENLKISYAGLVGSVLSITGSLLLILMYILLKKQRKFRSRILVYMSITNIIWVCSIFAGLCYYISNKSNSSFTIPKHSCQATGFLLQWFIVSEDFWVTTISVYMYFAIVRQKDLVPYEKYILAINWGVPFIIALLPFFGVGGGYDVAGTWCWVKDPVARMYFSYLFAWLTFAIIITSYIFIFLYIRGTTKEVEDLKKQQATKSVRRRNRDIFKKLFAYPIMFLVQWIPATVNRAQNVAAPDDPIVSLYIVHVFVITSAGFVNFVLYGFNNADFFKNIRLLVGSFFSTTTNTDGEIDVALEEQTSMSK